VIHVQIDPLFFGQLIDRIMQEGNEGKGFTQEELAEVLGVERSNISNWSTGRYMPGDDKIGALAQLAGMDKEDLLFVKQALRLQKKGLDLTQFKGELLSKDELEVIMMMRDGDYAGVVQMLLQRMRKTA
jgi:transcriptional regulator with XRE-family HTH domain